jgi:hypothetical protein
MVRDGALCLLTMMIENESLAQDENSPRAVFLGPKSATNDP